MRAAEIHFIRPLPSQPHGTGDAEHGSNTAEKESSLRDNNDDDDDDDGDGGHASSGAFLDIMAARLSRLLHDVPADVALEV